SLDQRDLGIFEPLKTPAVELDAEDGLIRTKAVFDHFQNAGFASAPVAMNSDRHGALGLFAQQLDDGLGDRLVIEEIDLGLIVRENHLDPFPPAAIRGEL